MAMKEGKKEGGEGVLFLVALVGSEERRKEKVKKGSHVVDTAK